MTLQRSEKEFYNPIFFINIFIVRL